jgi:hypothetical protein
MRVTDPLGAKYTASGAVAIPAPWCASGLKQQRALVSIAYWRLPGETMLDPTDIHLDDVVRLRKPHPCGGYEWQVVRKGTDIGIRCLTCQRKVLIPRSQFIKRVKAIVSRGPDVANTRPV